MALRIYGDVVQMCADLKVVVARIERADKDLARQLRRAACSVVLNLAEGAHSDAGHARERFRTARGSAAEVRACLDAAVAFGLAGPLADAERARLDTVVAVLTKLAR
jgi:four helix bundle protein